MANSGRDTNKSQFFFTLKETKHLDLKHTVFGKVVGGLATLERIEQVAVSTKKVDGIPTDAPMEEITILNTIVFTNPIPEAEERLSSFVAENMRAREAAAIRKVLPIGQTWTDAEQIMKPVLPSIEGGSKKSRV
jgi:peptidyl-prolyl cis-trans isomerase-like protein 2